MANSSGANSPVIVGTVMALVILTFFGILWSVALFIVLNKCLVESGLDLLNALVLLSGILMLPSNMFLFQAIGRNEQICYNSRICNCPLWLNFFWGTLIHILGVILALIKCCTCRKTVVHAFENGMSKYKSSTGHKHFVDNLQWNFNCCGLKSYKDWFDYDWYDKVRDYEWDAPSKDQEVSHNMERSVSVDSVPQSCCKTGSCISNYLTELGTNYINTQGCMDVIHRVLLAYVIVTFIYFVVLIILDIMIIRLSIVTRVEAIRRSKYDVCHIMTVKDSFRPSSDSNLVEGDESDD